MQYSEPPTWGQIKKLMDMAMMITCSLGIAGNPTATLQYRWVLSRAMYTGLSCPSHQWCILSLSEPPCICLY
jgi:hypothetical protein